MFVSPGDIAFCIGSVPIYYYGIIMSVALFAGIFTARCITKKFYPELSTEIIYDIAPHIIIGAIVFARLYYCVLSYHYYLAHPIEILEIRQGGISIHGAIIGGLIFGAIYALRHKLPVLKLCDIFSYGLVLGQAIGRWGNFFNSEAFGMPTGNFLKLYIPIYKRPLEYLQYNYFHPTFLYESISDIVIFLLLFFVIRKLALYPSPNFSGTQELKFSHAGKSPLPQGARVERRDGVVFFSYLILYSIVRIIIEQIRIDSVLNLWGIPIAQIVSVLIILISVGFLLRIYWEKSR